MRTLEKRSYYVVKDYLYRKKHGETFPVNKIVIKTKVLTAYYIFQFSTGSGVIRNAHSSTISKVNNTF